jgi:hypothetical protein
MKPVFKFPTTLLQQEAVDVLLQQVLTLKEWNGIFEGIETGFLPDWLKSYRIQDLLADNDPATDESLASPRFVSTADQVIASVPALSYDEESIATEDLDEHRTAAWIKEFQRRFVSLKGRWGKAFADVEANHILVVRDLQVLQKAGLELAGNLGNPFPPLTTPTNSTLWGGGLQALFNNVTPQGNSLLSQSELLQRLQLQHEQLQDSVMAEEDIREMTQNEMDERIQHLEQCVQEYEKRFARILPIMMQVQSTGVQTNTSSPASVVNDSWQDKCKNSPQKLILYNSCYGTMELMLGKYLHRLTQRQLNRCYVICKVKLKCSNNELSVEASKLVLKSFSRLKM